jgi:hypothetical protein
MCDKENFGRRAAVLVANQLPNGSEQAPGERNPPQWRSLYVNQPDEGV